MINVASVVRKALSFKYPTISPFIAPQAAPMSNVAAITAGTGHLSTFSRNSAAKFDSANTEPTLKSTPPAIITRVMPNAGRASSPASLAIDENELPETKPSTNAAQSAKVSTRIRAGIALSIQFFVRSSPKARSGTHLVRSL